MSLQPINSVVHPETQIDENFITCEWSAVFGKDPRFTSFLAWGYYGGIWGGFVITGTGELGGTALSLTNSATNYIVVERGTGVISVLTTSVNWDDVANYARVYRLTCAGGAVTVIEDFRAGPNGLHGGAATTLGGGAGNTGMVGLTFLSDTGSVADSDPGNGLFKWNNATQNAATVLYFDDQTADGVSLATLFAGIGASGYMFLQQADDSNNWQEWKWSGIVDGTGYRKFTVTLQAFGGIIGDNKQVYVDFESRGVGTVTSVNLIAPANGITVSGGPIIGSGSITLALADDLAAIEALTGTGLIRRTGANTWAINVDVDLTSEVTGVLPISNYATGVPDGTKFVNDAGALATPPFAPPIPTGTGWDFYGPSAPAGWLMCDGSAVSRTTYAALFAIIGTIYGVGDGTTTFNLPDLARRVTIGAGGTAIGSIANTIGSAGGQEQMTLTGTELPDHNHLGAGAANFVMDSAGGAGATVGTDLTVSPTTGGVNGPPGGNPFDLFQPTIVVNKIIKT